MSNAQIQGQVFEIKELPTQWGKMYNVVVSGQSYGFGKVKPSVAAGDTVSFNATLKGKYWNAEPQTLQVLSKGDGVSASTGARGMAATNSAVSSVPNLNRGSNTYNRDQACIAMQAARNTASTFLGHLIEIGAMPFNDKTKAADKVIVMEELLEKYTQQFFQTAMQANAIPINPLDTRSKTHSSNDNVPLVERGAMGPGNSSGEDFN